MFGSYTGHAAGIGTSLAWTGTSVCFTAASRRLGPWAVNTFRILLAIVLHALTFRAVAGHWFPDASTRQIVFLALSGLFGLTLGDQALFMAFMRIGPRLTTLVATTAPLFALMIGGLLGRLVAGLPEESVSAWGMVGIVMTLGGVAWVVLERPKSALPRTRQYGMGVAFALLAAACQGGGLVLSKIGIGHGYLEPSDHMAPQAATFVRMTFAGICVVPMYALYRYRARGAVEVATTVNRRRTLAVGLALSTAGALFGPYLGVWMSLIAADRLASVGVAQTLCSLTPVFILPLAAVMHGERITGRAVLGAVVAVAGVGLLFLSPSAR